MPIYLQPEGSLLREWEYEVIFYREPGTPLGITVGNNNDRLVFSNFTDPAPSTVGSRLRRCPELAPNDVLVSINGECVIDRRRYKYSKIHEMLSATSGIVMLRFGRGPPSEFESRMANHTGRESQNDRPSIRLQSPLTHVSKYRWTAHMWDDGLLCRCQGEYGSEHQAMGALKAAVSAKYGSVAVEDYLEDPQAFARPGAWADKGKQQVEGGRAVLKQEEEGEEEKKSKEREVEAGHEEQTTPPRGQDGHKTDRAVAGAEQDAGKGSGERSGAGKQGGKDEGVELVAFKRKVLSEVFTNRDREDPAKRLKVGAMIQPQYQEHETVDGLLRACLASWPQDEEQASRTAVDQLMQLSSILPCSSLL